jgi:hypothetical protein
MAEIALGVEVAEDELVLEAVHDLGDAERNLAEDEVLAAPRGRVVEEDAVACKDVVRLTVVLDDPVRVQLPWARENIENSACRGQARMPYSLPR